jgi:hypothetical protein
MRITVLLAGLWLLLFNLSGQEQEDTSEYWKFDGTTALNISQVSLTNWASGGENSISGNSFVNLSLSYSKKKMTWNNDLEIAYGIIRQGEKEYVTWRKTDDKIDLASKVGVNAFSEKWFYSAMLSFKTQMDEGYNYPNDSVKISDFMAPAYLLFSMGFDFKDADHFSVLISPATGKMTIVNSTILANQGAYGVEEGENTRLEMGGFIKATYKAEIMKNVKLSTKINFFSNYLEQPENVDIEWETLVSLKANKYVSANLKTHLIYDHDIKIEDENGNAAPRMQFKEILGIGFAYSF